MLLGYALNGIIEALYSVDKIGGIDILTDDQKAEHDASISLATASVGMILTTVSDMYIIIHSRI